MSKALEDTLSMILDRDSNPMLIEILFEADVTCEDVIDCAKTISPNPCLQNTRWVEVTKTTWPQTSKNVISEAKTAAAVSICDSAPDRYFNWEIAGELPRLVATEIKVPLDYAFPESWQPYICAIAGWVRGNESGRRYFSTIRDLLQTARKQKKANELRAITGPDGDFLRQWMKGIRKDLTATETLVKTKYRPKLLRHAAELFISSHMHEMPETDEMRQIRENAERKIAIQNMQKKVKRRLTYDETEQE